MTSARSGATDRSREQVEGSVAELRRLVVVIERAREDERVRISRFLHDDVSQTLTVLRLNIEALRQRADLSDAECATLFDEMESAVQATARATRRLISELRPPLLDQFGLGAALEHEANELSRRTGITYEVVDETAAPVPAEVATTLFRIFEELASHVVTHVRARHVALRLHGNGSHVELTVTDDGAGGDDREMTISDTGLLIARERAHAVGGEVTVRRLPNGWTAVTARVPVTPIHEGRPA
jgi:signal transduction histidine kinase